MTSIGIPDFLEIQKEVQIAVSSSEVALITSVVPNTAKTALCTVNGAGGMYGSFVEGSTTVTAGRLFRANESFRITTRNGMANAKFIRATVDATVYGSPFTC